MQDARAGIPILALAFLVALWMEALVRAFSLLFLLNFSTDGPNATALLALLLAAGFVLAFRPPARLRPATAHHVLIAIAMLGLGAHMLASARPALAGALVFLAATLPVARHLLRAVDADMPQAAVIGVLLHQALRAGLDGAPLHAGAGGALLVLAAASWAVLAWNVEGWGHPDPRHAGAVAPLVVFIWTQAAFVGSTQAVAAWHGADAVAITLFGGLGLWTGATWGRHAPPVAAGLAAVAGAAILLWSAAGTWPAVFLVQAGLAACLRHAQRVPIRRDALVTTAAMLLIVALVFLHVAAVNWAFIDFLPEAFTHGRGALYLFLVVAILPVLAARRPATEVAR